LIVATTIQAVFSPLAIRFEIQRREFKETAVTLSRTLATLRDTLRPKLLSGELSVASLNSRQARP